MSSIWPLIPRFRGDQGTLNPSHLGRGLTEGLNWWMGSNPVVFYDPEKRKDNWFRKSKKWGKASKFVNQNIGLMMKTVKCQFIIEKLQSRFRSTRILVHSLAWKDMKLNCKVVFGVFKFQVRFSPNLSLLLQPGALTGGFISMQNCRVNLFESGWYGGKPGAKS